MSPYQAPWEGWEKQSPTALPETKVMCLSGLHAPGHEGSILCDVPVSGGRPDCSIGLFVPGGQALCEELASNL